jgi:hypothetical protein
MSEWRAERNAPHVSTLCSPPECCPPYGSIALDYGMPMLVLELGGAHSVTVAGLQDIPARGTFTISVSLLSQRYSNKISWLALLGICGPGTLSVSS